MYIYLHIIHKYMYNNEYLYPDLDPEFYKTQT